MRPMRRFARLYDELDASSAASATLLALRRHFADAPAADAAWALYFLAGGKPRQVVPTALLRTLVWRAAAIDDWLFDECHQAVGGLAETIAHVLPPIDPERPRPRALGRRTPVAAARAGARRAGRARAAGLGSARQRRPGDVAPQSHQVPAVGRLHRIRGMLR